MESGFAQTANDKVRYELTSIQRLSRVRIARRANRLRNFTVLIWVFHVLPNRHCTQWNFD
jgi:hypothetical protein